MKKINTIIKKTFKRLKKNEIYENLDLMKSGLIDSLELVKLLTLFEKKHEFNFKKYQKKHKNFIVKNLEKYIK